MSIEEQAIGQESMQATDDTWTPPEIEEIFHIHDDATTNWLLRKIIECRAYAKRCGEWCEREQRRAKRDEEFFMFRYGSQLAQYARRRIAENGGRRKSLNLPAGVVGFRTEAEKIVIDDEDAVMQWAREHHPEFITSIEKLKKSALNEHIEGTGEVPHAGVRIEPAREKFYVK